MSTDKDPRLVQLAKLREPFAPHQINQLPKPYKKDSEKGKCRECGGYHGLPAMHIDFVGHAALTDRFLTVDPEWTWEPLAYDPQGLPAFDRNGGMWIKLTICGVTRLGYGDAEGKTGPAAVKETIGDALRNAGMRFGAALDLWHKGDLHAAQQDDDRPQRPMQAVPPSREAGDPTGQLSGEFADRIRNAKTLDELETVRLQIAAAIGDLSEQQTTTLRADYNTRQAELTQPEKQAS